MGASKEMFIDLRMREDDYKKLPPEYREQMEIKQIDEDKPNYPEDELWCKLNKDAIKAYKLKKEREFKLRNN